MLLWLLVSPPPPPPQHCFDYILRKASFHLKQKGLRGTQRAKLSKVGTSAPRGGTFLGIRMTRAGKQAGEEWEAEAKDPPPGACIPAFSFKVTASGAVPQLKVSRPASSGAAGNSISGSMCTPSSGCIHFEDSTKALFPAGPHQCKCLQVQQPPEGSQARPGHTWETEPPQLTKTRAGKVLPFHTILGTQERAVPSHSPWTAGNASPKKRGSTSWNTHPQPVQFFPALPTSLPHKGRGKIPVFSSRTKTSNWKI